MRVLVVSPTPFQPATAGNRRLVKNRLEQLHAAGARIDFVYIGFEGTHGPVPENAPIERFFALPFAWPRSKNDVLVDVDWFGRNVELPPAVRDTEYDLLLVNYVFCAFVIPQIRARVVALETHDRFGNRHELLTANGIAPSWISATVPAEAAAVQRADIVAILRDDDRAYYEGLAGGTVVMLRHIEPARGAWRRPADLAGPPRFGFVGSSNVVNLQALVGLLRALQRMPERPPGLRIEVFGSICRDVPQDYAELVRLHGVVAEIDAVYAGFDVLVNAVFSGTGLKIKTVEALAYGRPVLCGAEGAAGFPVVPEQMAVPSVEALVAMMCRLLNEPSAYEELVTRAAEARDAYTAACETDFANFIRTVRGMVTRPRRPRPIRWSVGAADPAPVWRVLDMGADEAADRVAIRATAEHPLEATGYLAAACAAELNGNRYRAEYLLDVYLGALADGVAIRPPAPAGVIGSLRGRPWTRPSATPGAARDPFRVLLENVLTTELPPPAAQAARSRLRTMMAAIPGRHAVLDLSPVSVQAMPETPPEPVPETPPEIAPQAEPKAEHDIVSETLAETLAASVQAPVPEAVPDTRPGAAPETPPRKSPAPPAPRAAPPVPPTAGRKPKAPEPRPARKPESDPPPASRSAPASAAAVRARVNYRAGLGPPEGPFPDRGIVSVHRWQGEDASDILITLPAPGEYVLALEVANTLFDQTVTVLVNDAPVDKVKLQTRPWTSIHRLHLPFSATSRQVRLGLKGTRTQIVGSRVLSLALSAVRVARAFEDLPTAEAAYAPRHRFIDHPVRPVPTP